MAIDGFAVDVWMMGMTLLYLLTRERLLYAEGVAEDGGFREGLVEELFQRRHEGQPADFFRHIPLYCGGNGNGSGRGNGHGDGSRGGSDERHERRRKQALHRAAPRLFHLLSQVRALPVRPLSKPLSIHL